MATTLTNNLAYEGKEAFPFLLQPLVRESHGMSPYRLFPNVTGKIKVGTVDAIRKTAQDGADCGWDPTGTVTINEKNFDLNRVKHNQELCKNDMLDSMAADDFAFNPADENIDGTEIAEAIFQQALIGYGRDAMDMIWWGDRDEAMLDTYLKQVNGFYKRIDALITLRKNSNTGTTPTTTALTQDDAVAILTDLYNSAPTQLKQVPKNQRVMLVTGSIYDNLENSLSGVDTTLDALRVTSRDIMDGVDILRFMGVPVIPNYNWDQVLSEESDVYAFAHFAAYSTFGTLAIGANVNDVEAEMEYMKWEEKMRIKARYDLDTQVMFSNMVNAYNSLA